jgi:hypothetical protein
VTGIASIRAAITVLIGLAATLEQELLALAPPGQDGSAARWAAAPLVAHNTEFRRQQVQRLTAIEHRQVPPEFAEPDHESAELYAALARRPADETALDSWQVAGQLIGAATAASEADLTEPDRNPWLRGRQLWLQIIVRGFWHPTGHLGEYYLRHGQPGRAIAVAELAAAAAASVSAPAMARGMAAYNLACAQAGAGLLAESAAAIRDAVALNPDLRANVARDRDLAAVRDSGLLADSERYLVTP